MSSLGMQNFRAFEQSMSGKSGSEIRRDANKHFGIMGKNIFVESWAKFADKNKNKSKNDDDYER